MSCEDYVPEIDNDFDEYESNDTFEEHIDKQKTLEFQENILKKLYDDGGLRCENIIEIQYLMELIKYVPEKFKDKQEPIAKCLELIINMANQFLDIYNKQVIKNKDIKKDKVKEEKN